HGRFRAACERGALEVEVWIGYGLVDRGRVGGRGIEAAPPVMAAADRLVAEMPLDDRAIARWRVGDDFTGGFAQGLGRCRIAGTDIVGHHSGLFDLECEGGPAQLK